MGGKRWPPGCRGYPGSASSAPLMGARPGGWLCPTSGTHPAGAGGSVDKPSILWYNKTRGDARPSRGEIYISYSMCFHNRAREGPLLCTTRGRENGSFKTVESTVYFTRRIPGIYIYETLRGGGFE